MRRAVRHIAMLGAAGLLAAAPGACSTGAARLGAQPEAGAPLAWPDASRAYARLVALRDAERGAGVARPVPALRGLDTQSLSPIRPDEPGAGDAVRPLADVLLVLAAPRPAPAGAVTPAPPAEGALVRAQSLYASGVAKLLDDDAAGAARDLAGAAQLDPTAPAPWLRLAEAQARLGQTGAAMLSRRKAADLGADDPLTLGAVGIQFARTGQHDLAAHYLARCLASEPERADPLLRQVAMVRIADPLSQLGYLQASIDALQEGLELPRRLNAPTRFAEDAADIARRASDLWVQIGDTACRLGNDSLAAEAYATAAGVPSVDPGAVLARRAFVLLRSGRESAVALLVLDDIASRGGRADTRDLALLSLLRAQPELAPLLAEALADLDGAVTDRTATTDTLLALARAAVSPDGRAIDLLTDRAAQAPGDPRLLDAIFARCASADAVEALALDLIERSPDSASAVARALLPRHPAPWPLCARLPDTPAGRLLRAHLLIAMGRPADALAGVSDAPGSAPLTEAAALAAAEAGAWDRLEALLATLERPIARARVLKAAQRYEEAGAALTPALDENGAPMGALLLSAELSLNTGDADRCAALLDRALALDPFDERVYEGLINVRQATGDTPGAAEAVRTLRERVPSSHLLRWVGVQEEAKRGLLDQAERSARELAEDTTDNAGPLGLLLSIWGQRNAVGDTGSLENAAEWLAGLTASPPITGEALAARGTVLNLLGRSEEAERVLRDAYASRPTPAVSRTLESLLLATDRAAEAGQLARARFEAAGAGIDASLDLAEHHARASRWPDAADAVLAAMPKQARLTPQQEGRILQLCGALAGRVQSDPSPDLSRAALAMLTGAETRGITLDWQLSYARWALLTNAPDTTTSQITTATVSFLERVSTPEVSARIIGDTATRLAVPVETVDQARAQIAYQLASTLTGVGRGDASIEVYRVALRYNPDHPWAANDLGYFLVERHESLGEAERLLEHAYALRPGESNIADSLGWLRYKLGQFDNQTMPDGSVRKGAVSLLIEASGLPGGTDNATVHDHLGDALWRSGERDRANAEWVRAQQLNIGELAALRDGGRSARRDQITAEQSLVGAKIDAVRAGEEPPVAPLFATDGDG